MSFALLSPVVDIAIISVVLSLLSLYLNVRFFGFRERMQSQREMKKRQKELSALLKAHDGASRQKSEELQKEMMESMSGQMKGLPKQMIIMGVIFLPPFYLLGLLYAPAGYILHTGINFPVFGAEWGWLKTYIVFMLIAGIVIQGIFGKILTQKKETGQEQTT